METYIDCSECQSPSSHVCFCKSCIHFLCENCLRSHPTSSNPDSSISSFLQLDAYSPSELCRIYSDSFPTILSIIKSLSSYRRKVLIFQEDLNTLPNKVICYLNSHIKAILQLCLSIQDRINLHIIELTKNDKSIGILIEKYNASGLVGILECYYYPYMVISENLLNRLNSLIYMGDDPPEKGVNQESNQLEKLYCIIYDMNSKLRDSIESTEELLEREMGNYSKVIRELNLQLKKSKEHETTLLQTIEDLKSQLDRKEGMEMSMDLSEISRNLNQTNHNEVVEIVDKGVNTERDYDREVNRLCMIIEDLEAHSLMNDSKIFELKSVKDQNIHYQVEVNKYKVMVGNLKSELETCSLLCYELRNKSKQREEISNIKIKSLGDTVTDLENKLRHANIMRENIIQQVASKEAELHSVVNGLRMRFEELESENQELKEGFEYRLKQERSDYKRVIDELSDKLMKAERSYEMMKAEHEEVIKKSQEDDERYIERISGIEQDLVKYRLREAEICTENAMLMEENRGYFLSKSEMKEDYESQIRELKESNSYREDNLRQEINALIRQNAVIREEYEDKILKLEEDSKQNKNKLIQDMIESHQSASELKKEYEIKILNLEIDISQRENHLNQKVSSLLQIQSELKEEYEAKMSNIVADIKQREDEYDMKIKAIDTEYIHRENKLIQEYEAKIHNIQAERLQSEDNLKQQLTSLLHSHSQLKEEFNLKISAFESHINQLEAEYKSKLTSLESALSNSSSLNDKLSKDLQALNSTYTDQLSAYNTRLSIYSDQNDALQNELSLKEKKLKVMAFKKDCNISKLNRRCQKLLKDNQVFYARIQRYEDMEQYLHELKAKYDSLHQKFTQLNGEHDMLLEESRDSMIDLQSRYEALQADYSNLSEYHGSFIEESKQSIEELQFKYTHLQQSYEILVERNKELLDDLDSAEAELDTVSSKCKELEEESKKIQILEGNCKNLREELKQQVEVYEETKRQNDGLKAEISSLNLQIEDLTTHISNLHKTSQSNLIISSQRISELETQLSSYSQEIEKLSSSLATYQHSELLLKQEISSQSSKISSLTQSNLHLNQELVSINTQLSDLQLSQESDKKQLETLLHSKEIQLSEISSQYNDLCTQRDSLIQFIEQNEKLRISLEDSINNTNSSMIKLKEELSTSLQQCQELKEATISLTEENKSLKSDLSSFESSYSLLSSEHKLTQEELSKYTSLNSDYKSRIQELETQISLIISTHNSLITEYNNLKDKYNSEIYRLKEKILIHKNQNKSYQKTLDDANNSSISEIAYLKNKITSLEISEKRYKEANDSLNSYIISIRKHYEDAKAKTLVNYQSVEAHILKLQKAIDENQSTFEKKEREFIAERARMGKEIEILKKRLQDSDQIMKQSEIYLEDDKIQLINSLTTMTQDLETTKKSINSLTVSLNKTYSKKKEYKQQYHTTLDHIKDKDAEILRLEALIKDQTASIYDLRLKVASMHERIQVPGSSSPFVSPVKADYTAFQASLSQKRKDISHLRRTNSLIHQDDDSQSYFLSHLTTRDSLTSHELDTSPSSISKIQSAHKLSTERFIILPQPGTKRLVKYDTTSRSISLIDLQHCFSKPFHNTTCGFVPYNKVLVIGGCNPASKECCIVSLETGDKHKLPDMNVARGLVSICYHDNYIYAFGGRDRHSLSVVERFDMQSNSWILLRNMIHERESATTLVVNDKIIIIGGGHLSIEEYDISTRQFRVLNLFISSPYGIAVREEEYIYVVEERRCVKYTTDMQVIEDCTNIWNKTLQPLGNIVFTSDIQFYNLASSTVDSIDVYKKQWKSLVNFNL